MQTSDAIDRLHALPDLSKAAGVHRFAHPGRETALIEAPGPHWVDQFAGGMLDASRNGKSKRTGLRAADVPRRFPERLLTTANAAAAE